MSKWKQLFSILVLAIGIICSSSPAFARFYSNDPVDVIGHAERGDAVHGFNRYAYAGNNPYTYTDPTGKARKNKFAPLAKLALELSGNKKLANKIDDLSTLASETSSNSDKLQALNRLKSLKSTSQIGDKVKTPDNSKRDFVQLKNGQGFKESKTGTIMQKSRTDHTNKREDGGEWKAGNKPGETPTSSNKTTISGDSDGGCVLKRDGC